MDIYGYLWSDLQTFEAIYNINNQLFRHIQTIQGCSAASRLFLLLQELLLKAFLNALKLQTRLLTFLSTAWPTGVLTTWKWLEKVVVTFGLAKAEVLEKSSVCLLEYYEHFMNILEYNRIQKQNSIPSGQSSIRFITRLASAMASLPPDWIAPGAQAFLKCSWHPNLQRKVSRIPVV